MARAVDPLDESIVAAVIDVTRCYIQRHKYLRI